MKWYFKVLGGHTHVRVFVNGAACGHLIFRNEEFDQIAKDQKWMPAPLIEFVHDPL